MAIIQDLTIFGDDDVTPLLGSVNVDGTVNVATCSTDPTHPRPYMQTIDSGIVNTSIDFKNGTSTMGGCNVSVVDAPITAGDQTTGWFTQLLADAVTHDTAILMRRAIIRQQDTAGVMRPVFDGIILDPTLDANMVTYHMSLRDVRERERKQPIFQHALGTSVVPRGVVAGYGTIYGTLSSFPATQIIKPAGWEYGTFRRDPHSPQNGVYSGRVELHDAKRYSTQWWSDWTVKNTDMLNTFGLPLPVFDTTSTNYVATRFANIVAQWRITGSGTAFKSVADMPQGVGMQYDTSSALLITSRGLPTIKGPALSYITISSLTSSDLPADGALVDVRVISNMPPSDDAPMFIEKKFWQLLMDIYDGLYAANPTLAAKVRYDHTRLATLLARSPMARAKITKPADDMLPWVAENIYKPLGYAPGINEQGEVYPVSLALPDAATPLLTLNDSNMMPSGTSWTHKKDDAITSTAFTYQRDYVAAPDPAKRSWSDILHGVAFDMTNDYERLLSQEIQVRRVNSSTVLFGDKPMTYEPVTVHSVTTDTTGLTLTGNVGDELGVQLANQQELAVKDRFSQSAQQLTAQCRADDAGVRAAQLGDWCIVGASWLPDYMTRKRGMNRLMQIIQIQTPSATSRTFTLSDAGPSVAPLAQPVIGNLRIVSGNVLVDVTSVPAGGEAEVQYAVAAVEPDATSADWLVVGRTAVVATLSTPSVAVGTTVWMRSVGKGVGRISSAPSTTIHIAIPLVPAITAVSTSINAATNQVQINWTPLTNTAGLRIAYAIVTDPDSNPTLSTTVDVDASLNTFVLGPAVPEGSYLIFTLTPYSVFSGSTASGTAGTTAGRYTQGNLPDGAAGASTIGPNLVVTPNPGPSSYSIAWSGDGVLLSIDGAGYGAPSASPIVVTLDAGSHTYAFTGTKNSQTVTDTVTVPALAVSGVNTVTPDLNVVQGTSTPTTTPFTVTASNPSGGAAPTIKATVTGTTATGSSVGALTPGTATTIPSGEVITVARPANGSLPASISFVADLGTGNGKEMIGWPIVNQDLPYNRVDITITSSTATQQTVLVTATAPSGTPTVQLVGITGSATLLSGPAVGVASASGTSWTFTRGPALGGDGQAQFRAVLAGAVTDDDFDTIPAQGRDTTYLVMRARVTASSAASLTVRVAVADPYPQGAGSVAVTYQSLGVGTVTPASGGTLTPVATLTEAAGTYIDYTIARPAYGSGTGRVTFTANAAGRVSDSDAVDVPAQDQPADPVVGIASDQVDRTVSAVTLTLSGRYLPPTYAWALYKVAPASGGNYFLNYDTLGSGPPAVASGSNSSSPLSGNPTVSVTADVASIDHYVLLVTTAPLPGGTWLADDIVTVMPRLVAIGGGGDLPGYLPLGGGSLTGAVSSGATFSATRFISTQATGTAPLTVASTTVVTNLNADLLDGQHGAYYAAASSLGSYLTTAAAASTYVPLAGGTFTGNINGTTAAFSSDISARTITSTVASGSGIPPFYVDSQQKVINLNADLLDGYSSTDFVLASGGTTLYLLKASPVFTGTLSGPTISGIGTFSGGRITLTQPDGAGIAPMTVTSRTMVSNLNAELFNSQNASYYAATSDLLPLMPKAGGAFTGAVTSNNTFTATRFISTQATGTAPFTVASTTVVTNLNADMVDGLNASSFALTSALSAYLTTSAAASTYAPKASPTFTGTVTAPIFTSTQATGTSPFFVDSTTMVNNLNANLLGGHPYTDFLLSTSTAFVPKTGGAFTGAITGTSAGFSTFSGVTYTSTQLTGTAPFTVASTTMVANLNAQYLNGVDSSGFLTSSSLTPYAPLAGAAFTGAVSVTSATPQFVAHQTSSTGYGSIRIYNDQNTGSRALEIDYTGSAYAGSIITGAPTGERGAIYTTGNYGLTIGTNNTERIRIDGSGDINIYSGVVFHNQFTAYGIPVFASSSGSDPGGTPAAAVAVLRMHRDGTGGYSYDEAAEFRLAHGGPSAYGSTLELWINGGANTSGIPDLKSAIFGYNGNFVVPNGNIYGAGGGYFSGVLQQQKGTGTYYDVPTMTIDTASPPSSSSGYPVGHVWIQVSAPL